MGLDEEMLVPVESPLVAFDGIRVFSKGISQLMVHAAERTLPVDFLVMRANQHLMQSWARNGSMQYMAWLRLYIKL